ncbi:MAG: hypothetical protein KJ077_10425 [Anaerolineae bacterium]|nr:hypothetical protein [Anaerolineae bacterium]
MANIRINKDFEYRLENLLALPMESLTVILSQLEKAEIGIAPEKLAERVHEATGISKEELKNILGLVFNLNHLKAVTGFSSEKIADDLVEALQGTENEKLKDAPCKEYLLKVMSIEGAIFTTIKASVAAANRGKLLLDTELITDIRPIFNGNKLKSSVIIHNLKIEYTEGEDTRTIYFAVDRQDLRKLKDSIQDAELREGAIKSKFGTEDFTFIDLEDEEA